MLGVAGLGAVLWLQLSAEDGSSAPQPPPQASAPARETPADPLGSDNQASHATLGRARIEAALAEGVEAGAALGGSLEAAAMADSWAEPVVETSAPSGAGRYMRMWSMSKVATMVALLRALNWRAQAGTPTSPEVDEALAGAIRRSENCHQRRVVRELERVAGSAAGARTALAGVFAVSGTEVRVGTATEAAEEVCAPYLEAQVGVEDPMGPALLLGTSTWRVGDAALFMHALATERFGAVVSRRVLTLMRAPKLVSREVPPGELTAPLDWGAGRAFAGLEPAYKAGWGGVLNGDFLAGQVMVLSLPGGEHLSLAVMFHPDAQPSRDDPGITTAPAAVEGVMTSLREALRD